MSKFFGSLVVTLILTSSVLSQVGVNTTTPRGELEVLARTNGGGFLTPRYALSGATDVVTVTNPQGGALIAGTIIYNTATVGGGNAVDPGLVYWNGTVWSPLVAAGGGGSGGWELTGNSISATDFLGSTNAQPLNFRVQNNDVGSFLTTNSFRLGRSTTLLGSGSVALGFEANVNGTDAVAIGRKAAATAGSTTALGFDSVADMADATALGRGAKAKANGATAAGLQATASGTASAAYGQGSRATGTRAIAIGLGATADKDDAAAIGKDSKAQGARATAVGNAANSSGADAIAVGEATAAGSRAIAIGKGAKTANDDAISIGNNANTNAFNNAVALGRDATVTENNMIRLGGTNIGKIEGQVAYSFPSDERFKYDISENVPGVAFIQNLKTVTYKFDRDALSKFRGEKTLAKNLNIIESGFLAQNVEEAARLVGYDFNGVNVPKDKTKDNYTLSYSLFVVPLVKAVQEQQAQLEQQQAQIEELKYQIQGFKELKQELKEIKALLSKG